MTPVVPRIPSKIPAVFGDVAGLSHFHGPNPDALLIRTPTSIISWIAA